MVYLESLPGVQFANPSQPGFRNLQLRMGEKCNDILPVNGRAQKSHLNYVRNVTKEDVSTPKPKVEAVRASDGIAKYMALVLLLIQQKGNVTAPDFTYK